MKIAVMNYAGKSPNKGGPTGYLYNLYRGFNDEQNVPDFLYVEEFVMPHKQKNNQTVSTKENKFKRCLLELGYFLILGIRCRKKLKNKVNQYDVIHAHGSQDVYYLRKYCKYKGKIILTSHRPESYIDEGRPILNKCDGWIYKPFKWFYNHMESLSYKEADGFIFPSPHAMEIYKNFPGFNKALKNKPVEYVYTGCVKKPVTIDKDEYRSKYNIPNEHFVVTFIGRHTKIKGYDRLVSAFSELEKKDITVVVAGASSDIMPPNSTKWIELGYITDANNLMNASDVVVIPNRNTYYDLVIIEALSQGCIVISSNTGGNIDIAQNTEALILFDNNDEHDLVRKILEIYDENDDIKEKYHLAAKQFYDHYGENTVFAKNFLKALDSVSKRV